jgi:hypothetical protein
MSKRPASKLGSDLAANMHDGRVRSTTLDTNLRPPATSVPDLSVVAGIYLDSLRSGRRPIQALMERFNVDRESAKAWPSLCRTAGLLPARDQPQLRTVPDETMLWYPLAD